MTLSSPQFAPQPGAPTPSSAPPQPAAPLDPVPAFGDFYDQTVAKAYRLARLMTVDVAAAEAVLQESYLRAGSRLEEPAALGLSQQAWFLALVRETALRPD